jgi:plastocyanin
VISRMDRLIILAMMGLITPAMAGETIRVTMSKLKLDPPQVSAHVGDTIEWTNSDFVAHTATARKALSRLASKASLATSGRFANILNLLTRALFRRQVVSSKNG